MVQRPCRPISVFYPKSPRRLAMLLCTTALFMPVATAQAQSVSPDDSLKILTYNVDYMSSVSPEQVFPFFKYGNFDIIAFQETHPGGPRETYGWELADYLTTKGIGIYQIEDPDKQNVPGNQSMISRLDGEFLKRPVNYWPGNDYFLADATQSRPETAITSVHTNYNDGSYESSRDRYSRLSRVEEAKIFNDWAASRDLPTILAGDFNAGDVSERGLQPGETYPAAGNMPVTLNILKHQYQLLQTESERELFEAHDLGDGRYTWPSVPDDRSKDEWPAWQRDKIDHFLVSRPFGKWYVIQDDPNDKYTGVMDAVATYTDAAGETKPISDHALVAHTFRWVGPVLQKYDADTTNPEQYKVRMVWNSNASTFAGNGGVFHLSRNNMRNDLYLGQIADMSLSADTQYTVQKSDNPLDNDALFNRLVSRVQASGPALAKANLDKLQSEKADAIRAIDGRLGEITDDETARLEAIAFKAAVKAADAILALIPADALSSDELAAARDKLIALRSDLLTPGKEKAAFESLDDLKGAIRRAAMMTAGARPDDPTLVAEWKKMPGAVLYSGVVAVKKVNMEDVDKSEAVVAARIQADLDKAALTVDTTQRLIPILHASGMTLHLSDIQLDNALGQPILANLTDEEKKTLLDCGSSDPRFAQAIKDYCIDDHSFIGETLVSDKGTVVVTADAALGGPHAKLRLDDGTLRVAGTGMGELGRELVIETGGGGLDIEDPDNTLSLKTGLSGTGRLSKVGLGQLSIDGDFASFAGSTSADAGTLRVNGRLGGTVDVQALLQGTGSIGALVANNGGIVAPGNSIGKLTVTGDATFTPGSRLDIEVDGGKSDVLDVGGKLNLLGGTVVVTPEESVSLLSPHQVLASLGQSYRFITASAGISGRFDSVEPSYLFIGASLGYEANTVSLTLDRNSLAFNTFGRTPNEKATLDGLESQISGPIHNRIAVAQIGDDIAAIAAPLVDDVPATLNGALAQDAGFVSEAATGRLRAAFGRVTAKPQPVIAAQAFGPDTSREIAEIRARNGAPFTAIAPAASTTAWWGEAYGSWSHAEANGNASGYGRNIEGIVTGLDGVVADTWRMGVLAGYGDTTLNGHDTTASVDSYQIGLYGGTEWGKLGLSLGTALGQNEIDTGRSAVFEGFARHHSATYAAQTAQMFGEIGYELNTAHADFEPFAGANYVHLRTGRFQEDGEISNLTGLTGTTDLITTTLGLRASHAVVLSEATTLTARGMLGWSHALGDLTPQQRLAFSGGQAFTIEGLPIAEDTAIVEAGFDVGIGPATTLGLSYTGQFSSRASDNAVKADLTVRF